MAEMKTELYEKDYWFQSLVYNDCGSYSVSFDVIREKYTGSKIEDER